MTIQEVMLRIEIPEEVRGKYRKVQFDLRRSFMNGNIYLKMILKYF